jgi:hypothetical protein
VNALLLVLLCEVSSPLGPYARPGVPVPLVVVGESEVVVQGWRYPAQQPLTMVYPATLPCTVRAGDGRELLRLEPVPPDTLLVGLEDGASLAAAPGVVTTPVRTADLADKDWPCLDVFDHVVAPQAGAALDAWDSAGGVVTRPGEPATPRALVALRPGNLGRQVYDALEMSRAESPAAATMRLVVLVSGVVMALQLLALRRRRLALFGLAGVAVLAAVVGVVRTRADYDPVLVTRITIHYEGGDWFRERVYTAFGAASPASFEAAGFGAPVFYRAPGDPWWPDAGQRCPLEPGVIRLFVADKGGAIGLGGGFKEGPLASLVPFVRPATGRWRAQFTPWWPGPPLHTRLYLSQD